MNKILRLRCECGRNLADVEHLDYNPTWTRDKLHVSHRPNVDGRTLLPKKVTPGMPANTD